jgi:hypothetical protein
VIDLIVFTGARRAVVTIERRRDRRRLARIALAMHAAGWPDHAICRSLAISRRRLPRLITFGSSRLADLRALVAAAQAEEVAA